MNNRIIKISGEYNIENIIRNMETINKSKSMVYSYGELYPYLFKRGEPATIKEIKGFKCKIKGDMPADFIQYLRMTNGLELTVETSLCSIQEILQFQELFPYNQNIIVFGIAYTEIHFLIDLNQARDSCIFITEPIGLDFAYSLNCNFTDFLNRYISCYGADFWSWAIDYENKISTKEMNI